MTAPVITGLIIEFIAIVVALLYFNKVRSSIYKYFVYYLLFVGLSETTSLIVSFVYRLANHFVTNIYILVTFIFYLFFYKKLFKSKKIKNVITVFIGLFASVYAFEFFSIKDLFFLKIFNYSYVFGSILLVITLILFLIEIINDEKIIFNIKKSLIFWISVGLLLFHIGTIPIIISTKYLNYNHIHQYVLAGLNVIMYGVFSLGFILSDKKYHY